MKKTRGGCSEITAKIIIDASEIDWLLWRMSRRYWRTRGIEKTMLKRASKPHLLLISLVCTIMICVPLLSCTAESTGSSATSSESSETASEVGFHHFAHTTAYRDGQFTDVQPSDWFANDVKNAFEIGMMIGNSETTFNPSGNVTIAETATIAARLNKKYQTGSSEFESGSPWYIPYIHYDLENGILNGDETASLSKELKVDSPATRAEFAAILSRALPEEGLAVRNSVSLENIPDVDATTPYSSEILKMYQAGILIGSDPYGSFLPEANIQRSAVAAIVNRLADPGQRKQFEPGGSNQDVKEGEDTMRIIIGDREIPVTWASNSSVEELKKMLPLTISMSMYGGFEQVGPIGKSIAEEDKQITTESGDIVLYSGNQIVVFYGSNSWAYTRLGHIDLSQKEIADLLSHGNITMTLTE